MFDIHETMLDAAGTVIEERDLGLAFENQKDAAAFMNRYVVSRFREGPAGYRPEGDYWWGCDESVQIQFYRYNITNCALQLAS